MEEITVHKIAYTVPATITGICPQCHEDAYIESDGRVVCPAHEAMGRFLADALLDLETFYDPAIMFPGLSQAEAVERLRGALGEP